MSDNEDMLDRLQREARSEHRRRFMAKKRVRDTSIEAWREIDKTLGHRHRNVRQELALYIWKNQRTPTATELLEFMKARGKATDHNDVRPRLTELCGMGMVVTGAKRFCTARPSKHPVYTWTFPDCVKLVALGELSSS